MNPHARRFSPRRKVIAAVVTTGAIALALTGPLAFSAGAAPSAAPQTATGPASTRTVTLITGDIVQVMTAGGGHSNVNVIRPPGATGSIRVETVGKDLYVIPEETLPYLAEDELDRRLFDVTTLIADGYDDAHSTGIPMILSYAGHTSVAKSTQVMPYGATPVRTLTSINSSAVTAAKKSARVVWTSMTHGTAAGISAANGATSFAAPTGAAHLANGLTKIWLDGKVHATLAQSTAQIGAPDAWAAGYDGTGVKVAILDTGADQSHPDLAGRISEAVSFVPGETTDDGHGHGTHTASTVGGSGAASGGLEKGVAPGANLIIGKVLSNTGEGDDSWVIAGMQWAAGEGAKVISMSLGGSDPSDGTDPMSQAVDQLSAQTGALFVIAAGNTGGEASMSAPGTANSALTVGAIDSNDQLAYFSSVGPRYGDYALKPDISAPGVDILAALAGGNAQDGYYTTMSGTSMATPHVAGAAAILAQEHPDWTGQQIKDDLMSTSKALPDYTAYQVGDGRVDIAAAITDPITATGSAYFGFDGWPHANEAAVSRTITYSNSGNTAITLDLAESAAVAGGPYDIDPTRDAGDPAPAGMFTLSAGTVTVPAHGTATVTATAQPSMGGDGLRYLGQIVATNSADAVVARTDVGLYKEDARNTLHITLKDRQGNPASAYIEFQQFGAIDPMYALVPESGTLDLRLPQGTYSAVAYLDLPGIKGPDTMGMALLGDPQIDLTSDQSMNLDASKAVEVTAHVPLKTEDRFLSLNWYRSDGDQSVIAETEILPSIYGSMWVQPTHKITKGSFEFEGRWRKEYPLLTIYDKGTSIATLEQAGSSLYTGTASVKAVYAGDGSDYTGIDVKGKIAIVTYSDALTGTQRAQAAAAAGAKLLLVVNNKPGELLDYVANDDGTYSTIPDFSVTALVGAPLVAQAQAGRLTLAIHGAAASPYLYDLVAPYAGFIPSKVSYTPKASDLATVKMKFYGAKTFISGEFRWDYRPYRQYGAGFPLLTEMPGTRTDYVSAQKGTSWASAADTGPDQSLTSSSLIGSFAPGTTTTSDWFSPVTRPRDGGGFWSSERYPGFINFNVQPWADGSPDQAGYLTTGDQLTMKVWEDGTLVATTDGFASAALYPVEDGQHTFVLDLRASRDPSVWNLSTSTHTIWHVNSVPVVDPDYGDQMPLMQLDYRVSTDLSGYAKGGKQTLGLTASHLPGVVGAGKITGGAMWVSYDGGKSFHRVTLVRNSAGNWTTTFTAPNHGYVTIRASAWDNAGNSITQTVTRAYGLK